MASTVSTYRTEYCRVVEDAGREGLSLTAAAGMLGIGRTTFNDWMRKFPEFGEACDRHKALRTLFLERKMLRDGASSSDVLATRFALINADPAEWRDKQTVEHTGADGGAIATVASFVYKVIDANPVEAPAVEDFSIIEVGPGWDS